MLTSSAVNEPRVKVVAILDFIFSSFYSERCRPGQYYSRDEERCVACPRDSYQPMAGQNFCIDCPGDTQTDGEGATSSTECKGCY
jgi:hypothetical protein